MEVALSAWHAARERLLAEDPALEHDEAMLVELLGPEEGEVEEILARLVRGAVHAESMADAASERIEAMRERAAPVQAPRTDHARHGIRRHGQHRAQEVGTGGRHGQHPSGHALGQITDLDAVPEIYVETVVTRQPDKAPSWP